MTKYKTLISNRPMMDWDRMVESVREGTIYQTTIWVEYMKKYIRADPIFIRVIDSNNVVRAQVVVFIESLFQEDIIQYLPSIVSVPLKHLFPTLVWNDGPIIFEKKHGDVLLECIMFAIRRIAKKRRIRHATFNLPCLDDYYSTLPIRLDAWATFLLPLSDNTKNFLIPKTKRKNIKNCEKHHVTADVSNNLAHLFCYAKLLSSDKNIFFRYAYKNILALKQFLGNNFQICIAVHKNKPISGLSIFIYNKSICEVGVARSKIEKCVAPNSQDLIRWKIFEKHFPYNISYDFSGVCPAPNNMKEKGIYDYKSRWGGKFVVYKAGKFLLR